MKRIRVLIGDADPICLASTKKRLATELTVIGAERNGRLLVFDAVEKQPDVVVLSISMRSLSGIEAAREIRATIPQTRIVFFTVHSESLVKLEALRVGASAYVSKRASGQLISVIHTVLQRNTNNMEIVDDENRAIASTRGLLTRRQTEILLLIARGCRLKEIAAVLNISPKTVEFHKYRLMTQLRVDSTAELIAAALRGELISYEAASGQGYS